MKLKPIHWVLVAGFLVQVFAAGDLRLRIARKLADQGQWPQAMQEVRMHLAEQPQSVEGYTLNGQLLLEQDKKREAAESFKQALIQNPNHAAALAGLAQARGKELANKEAQPQVDSKTPVASVKSTPPASTAPASSSHGSKPDEKPVEAVVKPATTPAIAKPSKGDVAHPTAPVEKTVDAKYEDSEFKAAIEDYREGKKDNAQKKLRSILGRYPKHAGVYYLGGVIRYEAGEYAKAAYNFKRAFDYPERGYNAHFYLGRIYQKLGRVPEAIQEFETYSRLTPSEDGKERAGHLLADLRKVPVGGKQAQPEIADAHTDAEDAAEIEKGKSHDVAGPGPKSEPHQLPSSQDHGAASVTEAVPDAEHHGTVKESPPKVKPQIGVLPMEDGFLFLISDSASSGGRKLMLAHAFYRRDRMEQAAQTLKELMRDFPGTENGDVARLNLAAVYLRMQLWSDAQNQLEAFAEQAPEGRHKYFDLAHYLLGRAYLGEGKPTGLEKAEAYLLKAKADGPFGPSLAEKNWQIALVGEKMPDPVKRGGYFATALATSPTGTRHIYLEWKLGLHEAQFGKTGIALAHFDAADQACSQAKTSDTIQAWCADAQARAADMAFQQRDWKGSLARYQKFLREKPQATDAPWAHYQIGNVHKAQGRYDLALNDYQKVIDNFPESYWAAQSKWQREDAIWQKEYAEVLD